jgi:5'-nucleotidase
MNPRPLLAAAAGAVLASLVTPAAGQYSLTVLHNNDGESSLTNVDEFVTLVDQTRTFYEGLGHGVLTLYAGDSIIPSPEFAASLNSGPVGSRTFFDALALDAIGYDAAAVGNHEFDAGPAIFAEFLDDTSVPYLSANLDFSTEPTLAGRSDLRASTIVSVSTAAGTRQVGIVGATTQNLPFLTSAGGVTINDVVSSVNAEVASLKAAGVDNVILVSHLQGIAEDVALSSSFSSDIDLIVAGGGDEILADLSAPSPTSVYGSGAPLSVADTGLLPGDSVDQPAYPNLTGAIPVVTGGPDYNYLGRVTLNFDASGNFTGVDDSSNPQLNVGFAPDAATTASVVDPVEAFVDSLGAQIIATSSERLVGNSDRDVIRAEEAGLGNLIADAYLDAALERADDFTVDGPDLAFVNGGGIRDDIEVGDISVLTTFDISPFGNVVSVVEDVTAADLALIFENAYSRTADSDPGPGIEPDRDNVGGTGRFLQVSQGVQVVYDITAKPLVLDDEGNVVQAGERLVSLIINGDVVVEDGVVVTSETFDIATADFLADGGDQTFDASYLSQAYSFTRLGITDQQAFEAYLRELSGGNTAFDLISDVRYDNIADGRIIAIPEPATAGLALAAGLLLTRRRR